MFSVGLNDIIRSLDSIEEMIPFNIPNGIITPSKLYFFGPLLDSVISNQAPYTSLSFAGLKVYEDPYMPKDEIHIVQIGLNTNLSIEKKVIKVIQLKEKGTHV